MARLGIVGLGLIGGSLALALRRSRPELEITGVDSDPQVMARALDRGVIREPGIEGCSMVVLAVPPPAIRQLVLNLPRDLLVTDVASTKADVVRWAAEAGLDFVGGHPMCGREAFGLEAADPDLFEGAAWVLTRADERVEDLVRAAGAHPVVMDADRHDRLVAGVSHAAFGLSAAYLLAATSGRDWPAMAELAAGGFRDMTRLASGSPAMYAGIAVTNRRHLAASLKRVEAQLAKLRRRVEDGDAAALEELFGEARERRERWLAR